MDKWGKNFDWNHARAFLATAKTGSLSQAARELGQTQPTIGRQISALEADLELLLFDRVGQRLVLTPKGRELLEFVEAMNKAAFDMALSAQSEAASVEGHVTITMSDNYASHFAPKIIARAREIAPHITLDIHAQNLVEDLRRREADIALRHLRPEHGELIAKRLRDQTGRLYGAKSYLEARGRPQNLEELRAHELIGMGEVAEILENSRAYGVTALPETVRYASNSGTLAWDIAKAGHGLIYMADVIAQETPNVEAVLPNESEVVFPMWLVTHRELHTNKRIRTIFDLMVEVLG